MKNSWLTGLALFLCYCQTPSSSHRESREEIIETLEKETQYFCERNHTMWQEQWSHRAFVSKMYLGNTEFEEFTSWEEINQFTLEHIRNFPDPIPIPLSDQLYAIELLDNCAWVFYNKQGEKGPVRETRFMVKEESKWKIARMQTIY